MFHRWRLLLVCLLVMAMPLQGVAAATMLMCAPPVGAPQVQPTDNHAAVAAHAGGEHGAAHAHHGAASQPDGNDAPDHTCSVCAACHLGLALPSAALDLVAPEPASSFASAPRLTLSSIVADGLERPPRLLPT